MMAVSILRFHLSKNTPGSARGWPLASVGGAQPLRSLKCALGGRDCIRLARIGFDRFPQRPRNGFKCRLDDMVAVESVQFVDMQCDPAMGRKRLKELTHQFRV